MRKVIQIATMPPASFEVEDMNGFIWPGIFALCDDGLIFTNELRKDNRWSGWKEFMPIPHPEKTSGGGDE